MIPVLNVVRTARQCWAALLLLSLAASSAPSQGLARSLSKAVATAPWSPSHQCVKELRDTNISPSTRGPTTAETYTYEKKFDVIDECFEQCQGHFIVQSKASGRCYCWREQGCQAVGFCDDGDCPGEAIGKWGSDSTEVVYDQSACYREPCEKYTGMEDSIDSEEEKDSLSESEEEKDSSDSEEEKDSSDSEDEYASSGDKNQSKGPWSPSHQCVKVLPNTDISPSTRGPTTAETYTYEKKFGDIDECFEQCQGHFIVQSKASGSCYCWREQGCQAVGFCDDGDCPGGAIGKWGSDSTEVVYDQSGCYGAPCAKMEAGEAEKDSGSDSEEEDASSGDKNQSKGPWSPSHQCVKMLPNTDISPSTRAPTAAETYTYEKKFDDIDECFEQCQVHFIVHVKASGRCFCWREQGCQAEGFCVDGDCPGEPIGKWSSDISVVVYDQSACYGEPCDYKYTGMEDSNDREEEKDSNSDSEDESNCYLEPCPDEKGPWRPCDEGERCSDDQYREECDYDGDYDSVSSIHCCSAMPCLPPPNHPMPDQSSSA